MKGWVDEMDIKQLNQLSEELFQKKTSLLSLQQELAENFYPERADFTLRRDEGDEFASHLSTSYPVIARRELSDQLRVMLRPTEKEWFHTKTKQRIPDDHEALQWLQWATTTQRNAMYDIEAQFNRATKQGDADFATFGQCVISVELNRTQSALLYRCWHLRDVAWQEDDNGAVGIVFRKWKAGARELVRIFGDKVHSNVKQKAEKTPFFEVDVRHMVVEADLYDDKAGGRPYWSIWYDVANETLMSATPQWNKIYVIPRWQTVSGSQYAHSPASIVALPDARLIQAMTYTLLEAGEKLVNPPIVAQADVVRSDVSLYAGGITWVDSEYDERLGDALRPLTQDQRGFPLGIEMQSAARQLIAQAFYLNKLTLPQRGPEMTAYEVGQRIQEYIRGALPLFEPMESEYNGQICEETFEVLMRGGTFGPPGNMPKALQGQDIQFSFESPLHDVIEAQKGQKWLETKVMIADAMALDPSARHIVDITKALRDALNGLRVPAAWQRSEMEVEELSQADADAAKAQQTLQALETASKAAGNLGVNAETLAGMGGQQAGQQAEATI